MANNPQDKRTEEAQKIAEKNKNSGFFDNSEEFILRFFRWISSFIDRLFFNKQYAAVFALILAALLYFVVNFNDDTFASSLSSSKTLNGVTVSARYNSESFELSGVPDACNITFTGEAANVNNAATKSGYCLLNLEGLVEGTHVVDMIAYGYGDNVNSIVTPSQATVTLKRKTTAQFDISYDFINKNQLDSKYILGVPTFSTGSSKVNIRASQDTLNTIALVKALIDVSGQTGDFEVEAPLVAYDKTGNIVNAEIVPNFVTVQVGITSPHKSVPIKLNITGEAPAGFSLEEVTMDHQTTEIYASEAVLSEVNEVNVTLDVSTITSDSEIIQPVILPTGVNSSEITMVNLKATLGTSTTKSIDNVVLNSKNNDQGYGVSYADTLKVTVIVTGTKTNLDKVSADDFYAYVDFAGLEPGTYDLPVEVTNNNTDAFVSVVVEPKNLNITLVNQE